MVRPQPPQQPIKDRKTFGIAVQNGRPRQFEKMGRHVESGLGPAGKPGVGERIKESGFIPFHGPGHLGRGHMVDCQGPRRVTPPLEIRFAGERDEMHSEPILSRRYPALSARSKRKSQLRRLWLEPFRPPRTVTEMR